MLKKGDTIYNPRTRKRERVSRVMMIQADKRIDVETTYAGDIAALVGLKNITTGDTLCDEDFEVLLEPPTFPEPVISMAVEPKTKADREKLGEGLQRLAEEDPTFRCFTNEETGQLIIAGMGECTWKLSVTVCSANSKSAPTPARRRLRIARPLPRPPKAKASSS